MKEINSKDFEKEVIGGGKVALDFYSTECPPCEALAPKFESVAELFGNHVKFLKIFRQENRELAEKLGVKSSPTVLFFDNGKEVGKRFSGGIKRSDLISGMGHLLSAKEIERLKSNIMPVVSEYDVIILGAGPGGLAAGLYLCQARINTVLVDVGLPGGQVASTHQVSNYPGFIDPVPGYLLSHNMSEQTKNCGTEYKVAVDVTKVDLHKKEIIIDEYETIRAKKIIIATGASPNLLNIPGEKEYKGQGISYCATCDAKYYNDKEVVVIGGGNSAIEEADFISKFAKKVTIVHQFDKLQANMTAQEKAFANPRIDFVFESEPRSFIKNDYKMIVEIEHLPDGKRKQIETDGVFIFIGMKPNIGLFANQLQLDQWGYIKTDEDMRTSLPDVFAVGDAVSKKYRQITTAVADGTIAAIAVAKELDV
ncbi:MAG: FAD-dependent oxidoreductase [Bacteroidales bacterium]|nr:FAD-dependent oxidoreductase [Bacteroidales bacterium]